MMNSVKTITKKEKNTIFNVKYNHLDRKEKKHKIMNNIRKIGEEKISKRR